MSADTPRFRDTRWHLTRSEMASHRSAVRERALRYSADLSRDVAFDSEPRVADRSPLAEYRGLATMSARDVVTVKVDACLVSTSDRRTGLREWHGRVVAEHDGSLLGFASSERIQVHIAGRTANMTITSLGEAASEIAGCGQPPF